jgi:hypothetical protein
MPSIETQPVVEIVKYNAEPSTSTLESSKSVTKRVRLQSLLVRQSYVIYL